MIWDDDVSFEGLSKKIDDWYADKEFELCDPPIDAQYALDLIFKTLIDDKENYPYLTTMPETRKQTNSIMLRLILRKYSKEYRKYLKNIKRRRRGVMNRLMCFLTGGHKYYDKNIKTQIMPDDFNIVELTNPCVKCGTLSVFRMNVKKQIEKDIEELKGGAE